MAEKANVNKIYAVEVQKEIADMAKRSIEMNNQKNKIEVINDNLMNITQTIKPDSIDAITVNPPYKKAGTGIINELDTKTISRHEVLCTLEDIIEKSYQVLKLYGKFFMIHKTERLVDILSIMREKKIEPKRIKFIHPTYDKASNLVLIEGVKGGKPFLKIDDPLYVYDKDGEYTDKILEIYNKRSR